MNYKQSVKKGVEVQHDNRCIEMIVHRDLSVSQVSLFIQSFQRSDLFSEFGKDYIYNCPIEFRRDE